MNEWSYVDGRHDETLKSKYEWYIKEVGMKVQRKENPWVRYVVIEESPSYYIVQDVLGLATLPKADYEPVQEWVDVTQQCSLLEDGYGRYSLFHNGCAVEASNKRYRVTKNGVVVYKVEMKQ